MDVFTHYAYNDSFYDNGTWSFNNTEPLPKHTYNYYAMLLTLLIFVIVFGNVLVCMAVSREKALQTTTNYLIVSLAVADLLVATLVMPWVVYLEVGKQKSLHIAIPQMTCTPFVFFDLIKNLLLFLHYSCGKQKMRIVFGEMIIFILTESNNASAAVRISPIKQV